MVTLSLKFAALLASVPLLEASQRSAWGQCGGINWTRQTTCVSGYYCSVLNPYYSQCIPSTAASTNTSVSTSTVATTTTAATTPSSTSTGTLDAKMKALGRKYIGTTTDKNTLSDPAYEAIVIAEYGAVTPENSMKWESTESTQDTLTFSDADYLVDWAVAHNKAIRGHTLGIQAIWHNQLPSWVSAITDPDVLTEVIQRHIANIVGRYAGIIYAWDVVNEIFNDDGTWRTSVFYNVLGESFVDIAFKAARAADPTAKLYINDYNLDCAGSKVDAVVALVNRLIADDVPIDGIGSQAHLILDNGVIPYMYQSLQTLANTGLEVALTELDIRMTLPTNSTNLADQQSNYQTATYACIRIANCVGVTTWGVSDKYSWVPASFSGSGAALLWDENFVKKPAYDGASAAMD